MYKNPWFTLVIGLMVGLTLGYVFAERQAIPPGKALRVGLSPTQAQTGDLPEGHPPLDQTGSDPQIQALQQQVSETRGLLAQNPDDAGLMIALGDQYFEIARTTMRAEDWQEARTWYEEGVAHGRGEDPNVLTDLAVVYRNLGQQQRALEFLDHAIAVDDDHWQAWFNKVIVLNFDLHDHDAARQAFGRLESIAAENPQVPDLTRIRQEVMGQ
jgi:tetratricopeptide (TPR) repeat protein